MVPLNTQTTASLRLLPDNKFTLEQVPHLVMNSKQTEVSTLPEAIYKIFVQPITCPDSNELLEW
jgi:hypothetical protein